MTKRNLSLITLFGLLLILPGLAKEPGSTLSLKCGSVSNPGGNSISVDLMQAEGKQILVSVYLRNRANGNEAWYKVSKAGWEHLMKSYEQAWQTKTEGVVGSVKAVEMKTQKTQPLGVVAAPGKGVVWLGVGPKGRVGVSLSPKERPEMNKLIQAYQKNLKVVEGD